MDDILQCPVCGYTFFHGTAVPAKPERPALLWGLIPARPAEPPKLALECGHCHHVHHRAPGEVRVNPSHRLVRI